jgi:hypothetical protein
VHAPLALTLTLALAAWGSACGPSGPEPAGGSGSPGEVETASGFHGREYERNIVFWAQDVDSLFMVPWMLYSRTKPGGVDRSARALLARGATWEEFYNETWETSPTRAPWRILPHESLRLVVGEGDALAGMLFAEGARQLELQLADVLVEWTGTRGQTLRLLDAAAYLSEQRVGGMALDMSRVHGAEEPPLGDWAVLSAGDSLQVVLEAPYPDPAGTSGAYRVWARLDFRDLQWPQVTVDWAEVSAFQPARRDVPLSWTIRSVDNDLSGALRVQSAAIRAGAGSGPMLPVDALFTVSGTLRMEGRPYPVSGLFRHTQP